MWVLVSTFIDFFSAWIAQLADDSHKKEERMNIKVKWTNDAEPGWVYEESTGIWQPVPGPAGRDRDSLPDELAAEIGYGLDIVFDDDEQRRRGWR
jgi:hypothetical protein